MKQWILLPCAVLLAALTSVALALYGPDERPRAPAAAAPEALDLAPLEAQIAALERTQRELATKLDELALARPATATSTRIPIGELDAAIARYMEGLAAGESAAADDALDARAGADEREIDALVEQILSSEGDDDALWQELRDSKKIDAVLAAMERRAELDPNDPDLQTELGDAYIQKLFEAGMGPAAGIWGNKADAAYDQALRLDDSHWKARFNKAVSLSNWPPFLGKASAAIQQFEILVDQQEHARPQPEHAQTFLFLGNMYEQGGDAEKALLTWRRGLERFPDSRQLQDKVATTSR